MKMPKPLEIVNNKFKEKCLDSLKKFKSIPELEKNANKKEEIQENFSDELAKKFIPAISVSLTILLIENTEQMKGEIDRIKRFAKILSKSKYMCIINYGAYVKENTIFETEKLNEQMVINYDDISKNACLYDALCALKNFVDANVNHLFEYEDRREVIDNIEIIGIGSCIDNCSKVTEETGVDCFCDVINNQNVLTKYLGLTENALIPAAKIGFHSMIAFTNHFE